MRDLGARRTGPFVVAGAVILIICSVVVGLPDPLLTRLMRDRILDGDQAGWAYRLLVLFALIEIVYGGYRVFRLEYASVSRATDGRLAPLSSERFISSLSRTAVLFVTITLLYGLASIWLTAQRGGFWLFPVLAVAQLAWYYRSIGEIAAWEGRQPAVTHTEGKPQPWPRAVPDYCPPITRGLIKLERTPSVPSD